MAFGLPENQEIFSRDMAPSATLGITLFVGTTFLGFWFFDLVMKLRSHDKRLEDHDDKFHEVEAFQEVHGQTLEELDRRIREKKDYQDDEEVEEGKYQAWQGNAIDVPFYGRILLWREKLSTVRKNQEWTAWDRTRDASCIVRDFYLGNSNPDFHWILSEEAGLFYRAQLLDTMINGWDSVAKLSILLEWKSKEEVLAYTGETEFQGSASMNIALKKLLTSEAIEWSRILVDTTSLD